jgi:hypothetical protein
MYIVTIANPQKATVNAHFDPWGLFPSAKMKHMSRRPTYKYSRIMLAM